MNNFVKVSILATSVLIFSGCGAKQYKEIRNEYKDGNLNVQSYPKYDFGDYEVEAPSEGAKRVAVMYFYTKFDFD